MDDLLKNFNYEPLVCNRFVTKLPSVLGVNDFEVFSTEIVNGLIRDKINVEVIESKSRNVAKQFEDIDTINEKLGYESFIEVEIYDAVGTLVKSEKFTKVRLIKTIRKFPTLDYAANNRLITTILQFSFAENEHHDIRN